MSFGLTFDSQSFDIDGAWRHTLGSLPRLYGAIRTRGQNRVIPSSTGRKAHAPIRDEVTVDMELLIFGSNDGSGTPHGDTLEGVDDNLLFLTDFVNDRIESGDDATYPASHETKGGRVFEADVQIVNWQVARNDVTVVTVSYDLRIPAGIWVENTP